MRCSKCGKDNPDGADFCGSCGNRLQSGTPPLTAEKAVPLQSSKRSTKRLIPSIASVAVIVLIITWAALTLLHKRGTSAISTTTSSGNSALRSYTIAELKPLSGEGDVTAYAINNSGQVVGRDIMVYGNAPDFENNEHPHNVLWQSGQATDLGAFFQDPDVEPLGNAINDVGQIVGIYHQEHVGPTYDRAFLWQNNQVTELNPLKPHGTSEACAINNSGQIVGQEDMGGGGFDSLNVHHAVLWQKNQPTDLGTLGGDDSLATSINNSGQIVGRANLTQNDGHHQFSHACLWQNGKITDIGTLGGNSSQAFFINDKAQVVGYSTLTSASPVEGQHPIRHGFIWQNGKMIDLGTLPGGLDSTPLCINNNGCVVGIATIQHGSGWFSLAFVWQNGKMVDLNSALPTGTSWILERASAINDKGQIVAMGYDHKDKVRLHAFLLTPK